jgi:glycosyltransferase involved in cell wall biosynthesis
MEKRLRTLYPKICHTTVLNNAFSVTSRHYRKDSSKKIVLGHLSNLSPEKGFFILVPLFERCRELGFPVELRIAGPANCKNILIEIQRLKKKYQNEVTYHGPIYGKLKQEFYSDLDFFVFPSFYEAEAQPIVLLEAMSCSSIPLASSSGGIPHILEKSPIAPLHLENFVDEGIEVIRRYVFDRRLLDSHRICCKKAFIEMKKISSMQLNMFVDDIVDQGSESSNFNSKLMGSRKLV